MGRGNADANVCREMTIELSTGLSLSNAGGAKMPATVTATRRSDGVVSVNVLPGRSPWRSANDCLTRAPPCARTATPSFGEPSAHVNAYARPMVAGSMPDTEASPPSTRAWSSSTAEATPTPGRFGNAVPACAEKREKPSSAVTT